MRCPECGSFKVEEIDDPEWIHDGLGNQYIRHYYHCDECGCEWVLEEHRTYSIEILNHGNNSSFLEVN